MAYLNSAGGTPVTARSTCSIFSLNSPGIQPKVSFGYEPEYPYNLDFSKLKTANGYALGMRSAPLLKGEDTALSKFHKLAAAGFEDDDDDDDDKKANTKAYGERERNEPASDSETNNFNGTPSLTSSPTTPSTNGSMTYNAVTPPNKELTYHTPSPPSTPTPAPKLPEAPKKAQLCGGYSVYKNSLPFRQLGWGSDEGKTVTREIIVSRPVIEASSPSPSPSPPPQPRHHRRALREPLLPMLIYNENNEEEYVSRYNYLPYGQGRESSVNALDMLLSQARAQGFTTNTAPYGQEQGRPLPRLHRNLFDTVRPEPKPLAPARMKARENLIAVLSRRMERCPQPQYRPQPQYNVMPDPPFPWMRR
ncbi:uncharacterized protein GIQ15_01092 [Arthroderma uncinatum]|uniref:uncharacterized protein n=1 Tax=Arthroderma uncinatum TaxID=74035 RepID=UPI00144A4EA1|nr:uncharacterized protein GIQ15_01092 [Arthroderma uncinatum]KAF3491575.1 hypothetical protein GIQ15_01092 [Arthroderma uncinatum]